MVQQIGPRMEWLLEGEPWVVYRTRLYLMDQPEDDPQVLPDRQAMIAHPTIQGLEKLGLRTKTPTLQVVDAALSSYIKTCGRVIVPDRRGVL